MLQVTDRSFVAQATYSPGAHETSLPLDSRNACTELSLLHCPQIAKLEPLPKSRTLEAGARRKGAQRPPSCSLRPRPSPSPAAPAEGRPPAAGCGQEGLRTRRGAEAATREGRGWRPGGAERRAADQRRANAQVW
jgi:hypothetical protein